METANWQERIVTDPNVHQGDPCIRGTDVPIAAIVGSIANGQPFEEILRIYPQLSVEDILAALAYVDEMIHQNRMLSNAA